MKCILAVDIGASSGRGIVAWDEEGEWKTEEVYRFANDVKGQNGHLVWDMDYIYEQVKAAIQKAVSLYPISSLSIDTWGVDYVLLKDGKPLWPCYAYRDGRTEQAIQEVETQIPFDQLYARTGCQFQPFNTIYQLMADKQTGRLDKADDFLMIPEYLMYRLTGIKRKEFTNATTTGLINKDTLEFDRDIIQKLDLPQRLFPTLSQPGTVVGNLKEEIVGKAGADIDVVLCATHDTASAVEGICMEGNEPYISSGTWSLLGVKTDKPITDENSRKANYSNEGGVGYNRYQKNIMGLWIVQNLRKELCPNLSWDDIVLLARKSAYEGTFDCEDQSLLAPASMKRALEQLLDKKPETMGDYFRSAYLSLAQTYKKAIEELEANTGRKYSKLYIVGGGAKNGFLNEATAQATHLEVIALPIEATAIGNLNIQARSRT